MDAISEFMFSQKGLALLAWLAGIGWSALRATKWWQTGVAQRFGDVQKILEDAVEKTYRTYVSECELASADGKLTAAERTKALEIAKGYAVTWGREQGVDVVKIIGARVFNEWIERKVREAKRAGRHRYTNTFTEWLPEVAAALAARNQPAS